MWNLHDVEKINPDVFDFNKKHNEDDLWWNQAMITHLDLSSNVLTEVSGNIRNLMDLTVVNVSSNLLTKTSHSRHKNTKINFNLTSYKIMH